MKCDEIRTKFLKFFEARGHKIVPSDSLVPANDPSLLFTGAGMNQFKEQFLGHNITYRRAATSQKCLRTGDLDNVGRTSSHHTFFEMLGNFSFGDYFKRDAIKWAWEFFIEELKINPGRLWVSVYKDDDEAYRIWKDEVRISENKIIKFGEKENFWPSEAPSKGPNGPCGPCSEIFFDYGKETGCGRPGCTPACDCGRFVEVWNLVFTQFERKDGGRLDPLPGKNIDTGMGLERIASVMQGVKTNFEIDIFIPIIKAIEKELNPKSEIRNLKSDINAIADHIRAATFAVADGVYPSNEERGFVVRKLIRRATQRALRVKKDARPFLYKIVPIVAKVMKGPYPELEAKREIISQIVKTEEERFQDILLNFVPALKEEFIGIKTAGAKKIPGDVIFRYADEKGVPPDLQKEIAEELGLEIDTEGFDKFMDQQKGRSRAKSKISKEIFAAPAGLARKKDEEWDEASKEKIRKNHTATHLLHSALRKVLGEHAAQSGSLVYPDRLRFDFTHPKKLGRDEIEKVEELVNKNIAAAHEVKSELMKTEDARRSGAIALFGEKYGDEVTVRTIGDFSKELCGGDHIDNTGKIGIFKITQETSVSAGTRRIEAVTGEDVYGWLEGQVEKTKKKALVALEGLMGEKGRARSTTENAIEKIDKWLKTKTAGNLAYEDLKQWSGFESEMSGLIEGIASEARKIEKEQKRQGQQGLGPAADGLIKNARDIKGVKVVAAVLAGMDVNSLRTLADMINSKLPAAVILLASDFSQKASLILVVDKGLTQKGLNAQELIKPVAACVGGSGGGRPDMAQAGGRDAGKIKEAVELIYRLVEEKTR